MAWRRFRKTPWYEHIPSIRKRLHGYATETAHLQGQLASALEERDAHFEDALGGHAALDTIGLPGITQDGDPACLEDRLALLFRILLKRAHHQREMLCQAMALCPSCIQSLGLCKRCACLLAMWEMVDDGYADSNESVILLDKPPLAL